MFILAIVEEKPDEVLCIALATIYGCQCKEITNIDSSNINLEDMTVSIPTEKKGQRNPQPIPEALKLIFSIPKKESPLYCQTVTAYL